MDKSDYDYIGQGIAMNLQAAEAGYSLKKAGFYLSRPVENRYLNNDIVSFSKTWAAAAGVGASVAIVYQLKGGDIARMNLAINTVISDLGGMFCDGAKSGCALKVASSVSSLIIAAYMAVNRFGITEVEGFVGNTGEKTISNLSRITDAGMDRVNDAMIKIMFEKTA